MQLQPLTPATSAPVRTAAAPPAAPPEAQAPLPQDSAALTGAAPAPAPVAALAAPEPTVPAPAPKATEPPPASLAMEAPAPSWRGELLELKSRNDYLAQLNVAQCGQFWSDTVKALPENTFKLVDNMAGEVHQAQGGNVAAAAYPIGLNVKRLMLCSLNAENECRLADKPDQPANRNTALQAQIVFAGVIEASMRQLDPAAIQAAMGEAKGPDDSQGFAQALQKRLTPEEMQAAEQAFQADPLVHLLGHPQLAAAAEELRDQQVAMRARAGTEGYLKGLEQNMQAQMKLNGEVEAFFQAHPEALTP